MCSATPVPYGELNVMQKNKEKACPGKPKVLVCLLLSVAGARGEFWGICSRHENCCVGEYDISNPLSFGRPLPRGLLESFYSCRK
jgi:hypothetical protein